MDSVCKAVESDCSITPLNRGIGLSSNEFIINLRLHRIAILLHVTNTLEELNGWGLYQAISVYIWW